MKIHDKDKNWENREIDAIAEQWVSLVLAQALAKKLPNKELIKIKTKYEYVQQ